MWDLCAGEAVPLAHTLNNLMNTVNAILQGIRALDARQNALSDFTKTFVVSVARCNTASTPVCKGAPFLVGPLGVPLCILPWSYTDLVTSMQTILPHSR